VKKCSAIAFVLLFLSGLGATARAQAGANSVEGTVVVTVPFEFVAGGKTLPAGKYTITNVSSHSDRTLRIYSVSGGSSTLLVAGAFDSNGAFNDARLGFERVDGTYILGRVTTPSGTYTLNTRTEVTRLAQMQQHNGQTSSGSN
jgi:hypothetical protein